METIIQIDMFEMLFNVSVIIGGIGTMLFIANFATGNIRETEGWYIASGTMVIIAFIMLLISTLGGRIK